MAGWRAWITYLWKGFYTPPDAGATQVSRERFQFSAFFEDREQLATYEAWRDRPEFRIVSYYHAPTDQYGAEHWPREYRVVLYALPEQIRELRKQRFYSGELEPEAAEHIAITLGAPPPTDERYPAWEMEPESPV